MNGQNSQGSIVPVLVFLGGLVLVLFGVMTIQPGRAAPPRPTVVPTVVSAAPTAVQAAAPVIYTTGDVAAGDRYYHTVCFACHGFDARGISGLGKTLVGSDFVNTMNDDDLLAFLIVGRSASDPLNTTGQAMPGRGGSTFTDNQLRQVIAYLRSLNGALVAQGDAAFVDVAGGSTGGTSGAAPVLQPFTAPDISAIPDGLVPSSFGASGGSNMVQFTDGRDVYDWTCSGCHGLDGRGIPNLLNADISGTRLTDDELFALLTTAAPISPHPVRGGVDLTDEQVRALIAYMRAGYMSTPDTQIAPPVSAVPDTSAVTVGTYAAADITAGDRIFHTICFACHGFDGRGVAGLGKSLIGSDFVNTMSDDELVTFIIVGRQTNDPLNTTGQLMPARGGNPALTDAELYQVVAYIRSLNMTTTSAPVDTVVATPAPFVPLDLSGLSAATPIPQGAAPTPVPSVAVPTVSDMSAVLPDAGRVDYLNFCAGCHGDTAAGIPNSPGSDLSGTTMTDADIFTLLTTAPALSLHSGALALSDEQVNAVIAYLRALLP